MSVLDLASQGPISVAYLVLGYIIYRIYRLARRKAKVTPEMAAERAAKEERWLNSPTDALVAERRMRQLYEAGERDEAIRLGRDVRAQESFRTSDKGVKLRKRAMRREGRKSVPSDYQLHQRDEYLYEVLFLLAEMSIEIAVERKDGDLAENACKIAVEARKSAKFGHHTWDTVPEEVREFVRPFYERQDKVCWARDRVLKELGRGKD